MPEIYNTLISLGVGGAIAGVVMFWKRQDDTLHKATVTRHADELARLNNTLVKVISANTRAMNSLVMTLREGRPDLADDDITEAHE